MTPSGTIGTAGAEGDARTAAATAQAAHRIVPPAPSPRRTPFTEPVKADPEIDALLNGYR